MEINKLKEILDRVAPSFYGGYEEANLNEIKTPFIIFYKTSKGRNTYFDDKANITYSYFQVCIFSHDINEAIDLATILEKELDKADLTWSMLSETLNQGNFITTIYEIKTEEFRNV